MSTLNQMYNDACKAYDKITAELASIQKQIDACKNRNEIAWLAYQQERLVNRQALQWQICDDLESQMQTQ